MGSALCSGLLPAFRKRQLSLVILHHPSSDTARYPADVEKRPLDLERGDLPSLREALQGLQIVMYVSPRLVSSVPSTREGERAG